MFILEKMEIHSCRSNRLFVCTNYIFLWIKVVNRNTVVINFLVIFLCTARKNVNCYLQMRIAVANTCYCRFCRRPPKSVLWRGNSLFSGTLRFFSSYLRSSSFFVSFFFFLLCVFTYFYQTIIFTLIVVILVTFCGSKNVSEFSFFLQHPWSKFECRSQSLVVADSSFS